MVGMLGRKTDMSSKKREDKVQIQRPPDKVQRKSCPNCAQMGVPCENNKAFAGRSLPPQPDPSGGPMQQN